MPKILTIGNTSFPFDEELFAMYLENQPNLVRNAMIGSGAMVDDAYIAGLIANGSNVYTCPFYNELADGDEDNYDGVDDMSLDEITGSRQTGVVFGRMKGWQAAQFVADLTAANPMAAITARIGRWYQTQTQKRIIGITNAVLGVSGMGSHSISKSTLGATSLSDATQEIWGDHKDACAMAIMHSAVAQEYEDMERVDYLKYTDENGLSREVKIIEINGIHCLIDDGMPWKWTATAAGVYTITVGGTVAEGDNITVNGVTITLDSTSGASAAAAATALKTALEADAAFNASYGLSRSNGVLTATEKSGHYGEGIPTGSIASTAGTLAFAEGTAPANRKKLYDTFLYGYGALRYAPGPVTRPVETWRDPKTKGGIDMIGTRRRETIHPNGFSFTMGSGAGWTESPTNAQLFDSSNWGLAYSDDRAVMIGKMVSPGHAA
jgi:hypothetical protein